MDKHDPPTSNGVFMPVGHVVISFPTANDMSAALAALRGGGLGDEAITTYTAQEMQAQAQADIERATGLASLGQDLNLVKAQLELARAGSSWSKPTMTTWSNKWRRSRANIAPSAPSRTAASRSRS